MTKEPTSKTPKFSGMSTLHPATSAPLSFAENLSTGIIVVLFCGRSDANSTLTYWLGPETDATNQLFSLHSSTGILRTATTFDYESNASNYTIQVLARDEFNATVEGNFTITSPCIRTISGRCTFHAASILGLNFGWMPMIYPPSHWWTPILLNGGTRVGTDM